MRLATILALAVLASPAVAELDPYKGSTGLIFPSLPEPHWGVYTPWMPAPRIGVEGGQVNPEFRLAERDGWDNDRAPTGHDYSDTRGRNVAISVPGGPRNTQEIIQGIRQEHERTGGNNPDSATLGGSRGQQIGGDTGVGVCGCH